MAAIVCLRQGTRTLGTDEFHVVDVVDGQQRITTLIILLKRHHARPQTKRQKEKQKLEEELGELLVKIEADELLLLQTNHDSSHHFANFLRTGKAPAACECQDHGGP